MLIMLMMLMSMLMLMLMMMMMMMMSHSVHIRPAPSFPEKKQWNVSKQQSTMCGAAKYSNFLRKHLDSNWPSHKLTTVLA